MYLLYLSSFVRRENENAIPQTSGRRGRVIGFRDYGIRKFFFADSIFNFPPDHAEMICREIIERGLDVEWWAYFRERYLGSELASLAVRAGCSYFEFSPDGFNDTSLKQLGKGMSLDEVKATYLLMATIPHAQFQAGSLFNYPGATWTDLLNLFRLVLELKFRNKNFQFAHVTNMRIYSYQAAQASGGRGVYWPGR